MHYKVANWLIAGEQNPPSGAEEAKEPTQTKTQLESKKEPDAKQSDKKAEDVPTELLSKLSIKDDGKIEGTFLPYCMNHHPSHHKLFLFFSNFE